MYFRVRQVRDLIFALDLPHGSAIVFDWSLLIALSNLRQKLMSLVETVLCASFTLMKFSISRGTFVQNMQTFWVKVPSQIFTVTVPAAHATNANLQEAPAVIQVDNNASPSPSAINNVNLNSPGTL